MREINAVLIMGHKNAAQLKRLIGQCLSPETIVFLHLDATASVTEEERASLKQPNVYFTETSIHGELDKRSLVDIVMLLVKRAYDVEKERGIQFRYFLLLSGQDYLIKPIEYINRELANHYPKPYLDCTPIAKRNWVSNKFSSCRFWVAYELAVLKTFAHHAFWRRLLRVPAFLARKVLALLRKTDYHKLTKTYGVTLYGGSAWWILPDVAVRYIVQEYEKEEPYVACILNAFTPEETFFQIMTMRSPVAEQVEVNPPDMVAQNCKTLAFFSKPGQPFTGHPYIYTKAEYELLKQSDRWIARKFDETVDSEILDLLDTLNETAQA